MGFTTVPTKIAGDVWTEAMWDTHVKDNFNTGTVVKIESVTLTVAAATITFAAIPQSWTHLYLVGFTRGDSAVAANQVLGNFNADTAANYDYQYLLGNAAAGNQGEFFAANQFQLANQPAGTAGANLFCSFDAEIGYYSGAANQKSVLSRWSNKVGTSSGNIEVGELGGHWRSSAAITSLTLKTNSGNFVAGSYVALYGRS